MEWDFTCCLVSFHLFTEKENIQGQIRTSFKVMNKQYPTKD